jgi:hypothetical protein
MQKVRETYADQLGDLINLDFAPKAPAAKPKVNPAEAARAAAAAATAKKK